MIKSLLHMDLLSLWRKPHTLGRFLLMLCACGLLCGLEDQFSLSISLSFFTAFLLILSLSQADDLFENDLQQGTLEYLLIHQQPLFLYVGVKTFIHWLRTGGLFIFFFTLIALFFMEGFSKIFYFRLFLGTWLLSVFSAFGACLTLGLSQMRLASFVILMPLLVPTFIFLTTASHIIFATYVLGAICFLLTPLAFWLGGHILNFHLRH